MGRGECTPKRSGTNYYYENESMTEQIKWRTHCLLKPKLRTYAILKKELRTEPYLEVYHLGGIPELAKLRGGTNRLRIEQGRYKKEKIEEYVSFVTVRK